jgi:hypothetical protein
MAPGLWGRPVMERAGCAALIVAGTSAQGIRGPHGGAPAAALQQFRSSQGTGAGPSPGPGFTRPAAVVAMVRH